ncbi:MAG: hypothetical protein J2P26_03170 [Nocardiopsaceae bacterium]|nr:hypothetical protein [Nocardiopsaceae bacterium]
MRPHIRQADDQIGFYWVTTAGDPITLPELVEVESEPERLVPTHLSALDDALIDAAGRWGEVLGGGRSPRDEAERAELAELHRILDQLNYEYAEAERRAGTTPELRAGQILGTSSLLAIRARMALDEAGPVPFDGELSQPRRGVMSGHGQFHWVDEEQKWRGGRWLLISTGEPTISEQIAGETVDADRYPLTLDMLLHGSGVEKDAAVTEHREALRAVTGAVGDAPDPVIAAGALEWLLYDWLLANRESESSAAIEIKSGKTEDAAMIVAAAAALSIARGVPTLRAPA